MVRMPATVATLNDVKANLKQSLVSARVAEGKMLSEEFVRQTITYAGFTLKFMESHTMIR